MLATLALFAFILSAQENPKGTMSFPELVETNSRDVLKVDPRHYRLEFENQYVRVLRAKLGNDETVPMHDSRSATIVAITEVHLRFTRPDKKIVDVHLDASGARWIYDDSFRAARSSCSSNTSNRSRSERVYFCKKKFPANIASIPEE